MCVLSYGSMSAELSIIFLDQVLVIFVLVGDKMSQSMVTFGTL
jgi:hypothetical protein